MVNVINDFDRRVKEIDIYFSFLEDIISNDTKLFFPLKNRKKKIKVDLTKILRANGFLLLYNLVESSVKKSIEEIYNSLNREGTSYRTVTNQVKKKWIQEKYRDFKNQDYNTDKIFDIISDLENDIIGLTFNSKESLGGGGNIDSRKIKDFSKSYGFSSKAHYSTNDGEKLYLVKNKRNDLAHGMVSFCDCGKDYTVEQMIDTKKVVVSYLRSILKNVETFINEKKYLSGV